MDQLLECLAAGCCIVSTCEELAYPYRKHPDLSAQLDDAAKEEGVALVGTGVNPGLRNGQARPDSFAPSRSAWTGRAPCASWTLRSGACRCKRKSARA